MAFLLLTNTVRQSAVDLRVTDSSDTETSDSAGVETTVGGPRHLYWTQSGTAQRRIVLVNKSGGLAADYFVGVNFHRHLTHDVKLTSWTTYTSSSADAYSSTNFAETLVGPTSRDFVRSIGSLTNKQAFGLKLTDGTGGAYTKKVSPFYFAQALEFTNQAGDQTYQPVSRHDPAVKYKGQYYHLQGVVTFAVTDVSRSTYNTYIGLPKNEPVFFYDSTGNFIEHYLWHGIILGENVRPIYHDMFEITWTLGILKHWT